MNALLQRGPRGVYGSVVNGAAAARSNRTVCSNTTVWTYKSKKCKNNRLMLSRPMALRSVHQQATLLASPTAWTTSGDVYFGAPSSSLYAIPTAASGSATPMAIRPFSLSAMRYEASSKVEETVKKIQEKEKEKDTPKKPEQLAMTPVKVVAKKSIQQKIWAEIVHYYHGFRLLFIDINVARKLIGKVLYGKTLTRREYMLLIRTTGDVFRLVPFSVFIIVPFMELLLPVFIKFFPGMLPSTFETAKDMEDKARKNLKVKLEMAKFLQKTLDEMDVTSKDHKSEEAKEFIEFFNKLRTAGERATPEEIMKFSRLFEDEITLDSLSHEQLSAICKVLEVPSLGTNNLLRFQLRMKLRNLAADDRMIQKEGVDSLTLSELQAAGRARGMRSYGLSQDQLRHQLLEWINLSLNEKVPPSLLLLSRAMLLPEDVTTSEKLKASISVLSDAAAMQTKAAIGEREGKIDNKTKIDVIRDEQRKIKEELEELKEGQLAMGPAPIADTLVDTAPIILTDRPLVSAAPVAPTQPTVAATGTGEASQFSSKDIETMSNALGVIAAEKKTLLVEKEEIKDLKEEIADYKEDVEELRMVSKQSDSGAAIKQSSASKMLLKKVDKMINNLDKVLVDLEAKEAALQVDIQKVTGGGVDSKKSDLVRVDDLIVAIRRMQKIPDEAKMDMITKMLDRIDSDKDGQLKVDDVLKIVETIGKDSVNLSEKQLDELIDLISKEEFLENEEKIEKALAKSREERADKKVNAAVDVAPLVDTAKVLNDDTTPGDAKADDSLAKAKSASKIDERINTDVIRSATDAAERQKDKILPLAGDLPKTPQLPNPNSTSTTNAKDKML